MLHVALNVAPGSTANLLVCTSPSICAEDFKDNVPERISFPENLVKTKMGSRRLNRLDPGYFH